MYSECSVFNHLNAQQSPLHLTLRSDRFSVYRW
nr:MAG TPA: hypothetical protein [Caudoviricetes sp.]